MRLSIGSQDQGELLVHWVLDARSGDIPLRAGAGHDHTDLRLGPRTLLDAPRTLFDPLGGLTYRPIDPRAIRAIRFMPYRELTILFDLDARRPMSIWPLFGISRIVRRANIV